MASVKLRLNKTRENADGFSPLVFQIIHNRRKKIVTTKYRIRISDFDPIRERLLPHKGSEFSEREVTTMHRHLNKIKRELLLQIHELENSRKEFSVVEIGTSDHRKKKDFLLACFDSIIARCNRESRLGMQEAYKSTKSSLVKFLNGKDIELMSVSREFVRDYESMMICEGISRNTIAYYIRNFKSVYNYSIPKKERRADSYPFSEIKTAPCPTIKRALATDELKKLVSIEFTSKEQHLDFARDVFLISFYCRGMSLVDILYLKKDDVRGNVIFYRRRKSKQLLRITITDPLQKLINKYRHDGEYLFPVLKTGEDKYLYKEYRKALARINRNLKHIGKRLCLTLPLTSYVARHSWATQAKEIGAPVGVISEGLGHSSESITQIYLKDLDLSVIDKINEQIITFRRK